MNEETKSDDILEIVTESGKRQIRLLKFGAMDGWELKHQLKEYTESKDSGFRINFTMAILSYTEVINEDNTSTRLSNPALVNAALESWENLELVFNTVLLHNNIDVKMAIERNKQWIFAGQEMATAFIAATTEYIKPVLEAFNEAKMNR